MKIKTDFHLVKGVFSAEEAKEVLFKLINGKIKYHQLEAFSLEERNMSNHFHSESRVEVLEQEKNKIEQFIVQAFENNKSIKIDGLVSIEIVD
jgi:hypothetical protein